MDRRPELRGARFELATARADAALRELAKLPPDVRSEALAEVFLRMMRIGARSAVEAMARAVDQGAAWDAHRIRLLLADMENGEI